MTDPAPKAQAMSKLKMTITPLRIEPGVAVPWLYGYSYFDAKRGEIVAFIIPLNILVVFGLWLSALFRYRIAKWFARKYEALLPNDPHA